MFHRYGNLLYHRPYWLLSVSHRRTKIYSRLIMVGDYDKWNIYMIIWWLQRSKHKNNNYFKCKTFLLFIILPLILEVVVERWKFTSSGCLLFGWIKSFAIFWQCEAQFYSSRCFYQGHKVDEPHWTVICQVHQVLLWHVVWPRNSQF